MREYALHLQKYIDVYQKKMILKSPEKQPRATTGQVYPLELDRSK